MLKPKKHQKEILNEIIKNAGIDLVETHFNYLFPYGRLEKITKEQFKKIHKDLGEYLKPTQPQLDDLAELKESKGKKRILQCFFNIYPGRNYNDMSRRECQKLLNVLTLAERLRVN